jgi:hypothetical protein
MVVLGDNENSGQIWCISLLHHGRSTIGRIIVVPDGISYLKIVVSVLLQEAKSKGRKNTSPQHDWKVYHKGG